MMPFFPGRRARDCSFFLLEEGACAADRRRREGYTSAMALGSLRRAKGATVSPWTMIEKTTTT
jgi:hypothetical protein